MSAVSLVGRLIARSPRELVHRGAQQLRIAMERARVRRTSPGDVAYGGGSRVWHGPQGTTALEHFRSRRMPRFFAAFDDPGDTLDLYRSRWPDAAAHVVERAGRLLDGRYDLLGHRDVGYGNPPDWHADALRGVRAPCVHWSRIDYLDPAVAGDHKLVWELNRHHHLTVLGRAYLLTADESFAQAFVAQLTDWMEANPPAVGINWASSLEVSFRAIAWLWALHFFRASPTLDDAFFERVLRCLYRHGRHIEGHLSTWFSPNTHLTGEALGLAYLGIVLPELRAAARWKRRGLEILNAELPRQVRADGVYFEQTTWYHRYTLDFLIHIIALSRANGFEPGPVFTVTMERMLDHLAAVTRPDGTVPLVGDDDGGRLLPLDGVPDADFRATLAAGAALLGRADHAHVAGEAGEELLWLFGPDGVRAYDALDATRPPQALSVAFAESGVHVMRDGWSAEASWMLIDAGPHGALTGGHAHADALSVVASCAGAPVLIDAGTFTYTADASARDRYRSSGMHNCVTVGGESSSVPAGPFRWAHAAATRVRRWIVAEQFDFFEGSHDGFARLDLPAEHTRAVLFLKHRYWLIVDRVDADAPLAFESRFHHDPTLGAERSNVAPGSIDVRDAAGTTLLRIAAVAHDATVDVEACEVSAAYGTATAAVRSVIRVGAGGRTLLTLLLPGAAASARVRCVGAAGSIPAAVVSAPGFEDWIVPRGADVGGVIASDFDLAWVRRCSATGEALDFVAIGGSRLRCGDRQLVSSAARLPFAAMDDAPAQESGAVP